MAWNLGLLGASSAGGVPAPDFLTSAPLWLDAADASTITESGGSVSQWNNKGTLENLVQASGALQPTTGTQTLNGLNVLDFNDDYLQGQTLANWKFLHDGTKYVVAAVAKFGNVENPGAAYTLFGTEVSSANIGAAHFFDDRSDRPDSNQLDVTVARGVSASPAVSAATNEELIPNQFHVLSTILDPNNATALDRSEKFIDDGSVIKDNTASGGVSTSNPSNLFQVGATRGIFVLVGQIAELIILSGSDANEANRQEVADYLNAKWSVF